MLEHFNTWPGEVLERFNSVLTVGYPEYGRGGRLLTCASHAVDDQVAVPALARGLSRGVVPIVR